MRKPFALHPSFDASFVRERGLFDRILRSFFGVGGVLWLFVFILPFRSPEEHAAFRVHQYQLYVLLLSLWGYQSRRDLSRLRMLSELAIDRQCTVQDISIESLNTTQELPLFSLLRKRGSTNQWWPVVFCWFFFAAALAIISLQLRLIFR